MSKVTSSTMRSPKWRSSSSTRRILLGAVTVCALASAASDHAVAVGGDEGINHALYIVVNARSDPSQNASQWHSGSSAILSVKVRISAHSQETNFFGDVTAVIPSFDLTKGSVEQEVWKDKKCHHERGLPKFTVTDVSGFINSGDESVPVIARRRVLGVQLPEDEVLAATKLPGGVDKIGAFIATLTETKRSRLRVGLKLYVLSCKLTH